MDLTHTEREYATKYISRIQRDARHWPWMRWVMLLTALLILVLSMYNFTKLTALNDTLSSNFTIQRGAYDPKNIEIFVEGQLSNIRLEFYGFLRISLQAMGGFSLLVYSLRNWNRHLKSRLIAKVLEKLLSNQ